MKPVLRYTILAVSAGSGLLACADTTRSNSSITSAALSAALSSVPVGYGSLSTSFVGVSADNAPSAGFWLGGGPSASFDRGGLMGGGLHDDFAGGVNFVGHHGEHGPFTGDLDCTGVFSAATGRLSCVDTSHAGVSVTKSVKYTTAAGAVEQAFDSLLTNTVNVQSTTTGTITYNRAADSVADAGHDRDHDWGHGRGPGGKLLGDTSTILTASTTVNSSSDRTVSGLASGSTKRTVAGTSAGRETTSGTSSMGSFTASRTVGDTTSGLVTPVVTGAASYPTAGTVTRSISASLQYAGQAAVTLTRREVLTYDGTAVAKIVITENGVTRNCTRPLPRGPLTCS